MAKKEEYKQRNIDFLKEHQYFTKFAQKEWGNLKEINLKYQMQL